MVDSTKNLIFCPSNEVTFAQYTGCDMHDEAIKPSIGKNLITFAVHE